MLKKLIQNFIGGIYTSASSTDPKKEKAPAQGSASNFAEIFAYQT
jgi:hypothetical protein